MERKNKKSYTRSENLRFNDLPAFKRPVLGERPWTREGQRTYHEHLVNLVEVLLIQFQDSNSSQEDTTEREAEDGSHKNRTQVNAYIDAIIEPLYQAISSRQRVQFVDKYEGKWVKFTIHPHAGKEDLVDELKVHAIDITRQKFLEETLTRFEENYRFFLDGVLLGMGMADLQGNVMLANPRMMDLTGFSLEELKFLGVQELYVEPIERRQVLKTLWESGKVRDYKVQLRRKGGKIYTALLNVDQMEFCGQKLLLTTAYDLAHK